MQDLEAERAKTKDNDSPLDKFHLDEIPPGPRVQDGSSALNETWAAINKRADIPPCVQASLAEIHSIVAEVQQHDDEFDYAAWLKRTADAMAASRRGKGRGG